MALVVTLFGLHRTCDFFEKRGGAGLPIFVALAGLSAVVGLSELHHVFQALAQNPRRAYFMIPVNLARAALDMSAKTGKHIYVQPGTGGDVVRWQLRPYEPHPLISVFSQMKVFQKSVDVSPPPAGSVLLLDFPAKMIPRDQGGWEPPRTLKALNIHDYAAAGFSAKEVKWIPR